MALDFWADHYSRRPKDGTEDFESDDFEAEVAAMLAEDDDWVDVVPGAPGG